MPIVIENLSFTYGKKSPFEKKALKNVSFTVNDGEYVGIVGSTGSGKSTLIQHINGLIKLTEGKIRVNDVDLTARKPDLMALRKSVGMLFQYPEYQLFAETVLQDVMFGPLNFGANKESAEAAAREALTLVGLDYDSIKDRSPLEISGGQKRRVAIAGVLAYKPEILVLDEPTAGLDPLGKREMLDLILSLRKCGAVKTVLMVSHNMDEIAEYSDRIIALKNGELICDSSPVDFFYNYDVASLGLSLPHAVNTVKKLQSKGIDLPSDILTKDALIRAITDFYSPRNEAIKGGGNE